MLIRLLTVNPNNRISAEGALNHEWLRERSRFAPRRHLQSTVEQIRRYNARRKLKVSYNLQLIGLNLPYFAKCFLTKMMDAIILKKLLFY